MRLVSLSAFILSTAVALAQSHEKQSIRFIFETEHDIIGNFETNTKKIKLFNHQNHLCYEADLFEGSELDETFFYYDKKNRLYKERRIFHNSKESGRIEISYDKMGNIEEKVEIDLRGREMVKISMTYDKLGNMTHKQRELKHKTDDALFVDYSFDFTYSEAGELLNKKGFEHGLSNDIYIFKYSQEGTKQIIEKFDSEGVLREKWIEDYEKKMKVEYEHIVVSAGSEEKKVDVKYGYDDHGNMVRERIYKNDKLSKTITFEYAYDPYGNWTEKKQFEGVGDTKELRAKITRRIEYFKTIAYDHAPMELDEQFTLSVDPNTQAEILLSTETHVRINDEDGNVNWVSRRNGPTIFQCDESEYEDGKLVKTVHLNNEKKENAYTVYEYNSKGQITREASYSFEDKIDEKIEYTYDAKAQLVKKEVYLTDKAHGNPVIEITETFEYDADGNKIKGTLKEFGSEYGIDYRYKGKKLVEYVQTPKSGEEEPFAERYTYAGDLLTMIEIYEGGGKDPVEKEEHKFNGEGDIVKSSFYEGEKLIEVVNYEYFE
jgi:hypothetical protein